MKKIKNISIENLKILQDVSLDEFQYINTDRIQHKNIN